MVGRTIAHYTILEKLGEGGMGVVYKARDSHLDRFVAIKVLRPDKVADVDRKRRFMQEAKAASALNHPNIVHIYDIDQQDGVDYIAMEHIHGRTLDQLIGRKGMKLGETLKCGVQIADALSRAHAAGIIHRDLKPGNIMVDEHGLVKVLDFGLAKLTETTPTAEDEPTRTLTATTEEGTIVGTVAYMSPEQARGDTLDTRTDLWSFGVILYEMVTGARPFEGATTALRFEAILNKAPAPVHERNPKVMPELEHIVTRLLEKDRETRYQSATDVGADLKRVERYSGASVSVAAAPAAPQRGAMWKYGVAAVGAILLAYAGFSLWQRAHAAPLTDKDVLVLADFTNTTGDGVFDGTLREALAIGLEESPFLKIMDDEQVRHTLQLMGRSAKDRITNDIAHEICVRAGEKAMIGGSIANLGKTYAIALQATNCQTGTTLAREQVEAQDKEHVLKAVGTAARDMRAKLGESLGSIRNSDPLGENREMTTTSLEAFREFAHGWERVRQGSFAEAILFFQRARELDPNFAMAYFAEAVQPGNLDQTQRRDEDLKKAFSLIDRVSERERLDIATGYYYNVTGELYKAIEIAEQEAREYPRWFSPHNLLAGMYDDLGELEKGLREEQEGLRLAPGESILYSNVIDSFASLGRFDEAKVVAEQAFARKLDAYPIHEALLDVAYAQGDQAAAQKQIQWMTGKPGEFGSLKRQARYAYKLGQFRKANSLVQQAADVMRRRGLNFPAEVEQLKTSEQAMVGNCGPVRARAHVPLSAADDPVAEVVSAELPAALCAEGLPAALKLVEETAKQRPLDTLMNGLYLPYLRAAIELGRNRPEKAVEFLKPAAQYEGGRGSYLRALAYLQAKTFSEAGTEFQKILDRKGSNLGTEYSLSYVGLARAAKLSGDLVKAKKAYQDFFALWKDADQDTPILIEARKEYAALD